MSDFSALTILRAIANVANSFVELYHADDDYIKHAKAKQADIVIELYDSDEAGKVAFLLNSAYNQGRNDVIKELARELTSAAQQPSVINFIKKE